MWTDPIVAEVRKEREEYARKFGYDLTRIMADLRKSEKKRTARGPAKGKTRKKSGPKRRAA